MKVSVYSRKEIESVIADGKFPKNTAVISFCDPAVKRIDEDYSPVDYSSVCDTVFYCEADDLDSLAEKGYTYDTYFPEAPELAEFINKAYRDGMNIIVSANTVRAKVQAVRQLYWDIFTREVLTYLRNTNTIRIR